jgi:hypothetical protein
MHTRAAIGSARLVEAILAAMRQFIGLAEDQQFAFRTNIMVLLGVVAKRVPLELRMNAAPVRFGVFFRRRPRVPGAEEIVVRTAAECGITEVMLCMFGPTSDNYDLLHRGTRCRKMHSSYRSTFRTIGATPLATVSRCPNADGSHFRYISNETLKRDKTRVPILAPVFEEKTTIQYYYPNFRPDIIDGISG